MILNQQCLLVCLVVLTTCQTGEGGVMSKALQEAAEYAGKKFAREVAEEGMERLTVRMTRLAHHYGDDLVSAAFRKVGPCAGSVVTETSEHGDLALRLLAEHGDTVLPLVGKATALKSVARYGDDAATAILKHGSVGEDLIGTFAQQGAVALAKVTPQNGRRLAMLAGEGVLKPELLQVVAQYGDTACEFLWRNKGALAVGTTMTAFLTAPGEFLDGTRQLVTPIVGMALEPVAEVPRILATEAAQNVNWTLLSLVLVAIGSMFGCLCFFPRWTKLKLNKLLRNRSSHSLSE